MSTLRILSIIVFSIQLLSCNLKRNRDSKSDPKTKASINHFFSMDSSKLLEHVKLAINPRFTHWVLFANGTYIIIEDSTVKDEVSYCTKIMKEYGPVYAGSPAGDFFLTHLNKTEGWVIGGHYYGMYTYVSPEELKSQNIDNPTDSDIGLFGRNKREIDGRDCKIIHINK